MANAKLTVEIVSDAKKVDADLKKIAESAKKQNRQLRDTQKRTVNIQKQEVKAAKEIAKLHDKHHKAQEKQKKQAVADHKKAHLAQVRMEKAAHQERARNERARSAFQKKERAEEMRFLKRQQANGGGGAGAGGQSRFSKANQAGGAAAKSVIRAAAAVASGLTGFLVGGATSAYGKHLDFQNALSPNIGLGKGSRVKAGITGARGAKLGYSNVDSAHMNPAMARATGALGPRELQQGMRATGMDQGTVSGIYGSMAKAGTSFKGGEFSGQSRGGREFAKLISAGMESGLEKGRLPEFAEGVMSLVDQRGSMASGDVGSGGIAALMTALGKTGLSGFQGERGANMMGKINQSFTKAGGGEWGDNFMRMAMGFGKPGGGTGYYEAEKMREKGVADPGNMSRMLGEVSGQFGGGKEGALALRELTGVSLEQAEDLLKLQQDGGVSKENLEKIGKIMDKGKSIQEQSLEAMQGFGTAQRLAAREDTLAGVGADVAKEIEWLEDRQLELLKELVKIAKDLSGTLSSFYSDVRTFLDRDSSDETKEALKQADADREAVLAKASKGTMTGAEIVDGLVTARKGRIDASVKNEGAKQGDRMFNDLIAGPASKIEYQGKLDEWREKQKLFSGVKGYKKPGRRGEVGDTDEALIVAREDATIAAAKVVADRLGPNTKVPASVVAAIGTAGAVSPSLSGQPKGIHHPSLPDSVGNSIHDATTPHVKIDLIHHGNNPTVPPVRTQVDRAK